MIGAKKWLSFRVEVRLKFATIIFRFGHNMLPDRVVPRTETFGAATPTLDINEIVFRFDLFGSVFESAQSKFNSRELKQKGDGW